MGRTARTPRRPARRPARRVHPHRPPHRPPHRRCRPLHRDPDTDRVHAMLARFDEAVHALEPALPRFRLAEGDILVLDNYRCWHGRDAHTGERTVRILTLRTADAR
nr:TauD/TfdA family dioxygenase [Streptomyces sudanensis]